VCVYVCVRACACLIHLMDTIKSLDFIQLFSLVRLFVCLFVCLRVLYSLGQHAFFFWLFCVGVVFLFFLSRYLACLDACDDRKVGSGSLADLSQEANRLASR